MCLHSKLFNEIFLFFCFILYLCRRNYKEMERTKDKIDNAKIKVATLVDNWCFPLSKEERVALYRSMLRSLCWGLGIDIRKAAQAPAEQASPLPQPKVKITHVKI